MHSCALSIERRMLINKCQSILGFCFYSFRADYVRNNGLSINHKVLLFRADCGCCFTISVVPPTIDSQPSDVLLPAGQMAVFTAMVTGEEITIEWLRDGLPIGADARITGINTLLLTITDISTADEASYMLSVSNEAQMDVLSNPVTLTIRKLGRGLKHS